MFWEKKLFIISLLCLILVCVCELRSLVVLSLSCPTLATPWSVACQAPLSMGFYRQEYWSGLPFPSPEDLPDPGIEPGFPQRQADSLPTGLPGNSQLLDH